MKGEDGGSGGGGNDPISLDKKLLRIRRQVKMRKMNQINTNPTRKISVIIINESKGSILLLEVGVVKFKLLFKSKVTTLRCLFHPTNRLDLSSITNKFKSSFQVPSVLMNHY